MKIKLIKITIKELIKGFKNNGEVGGVVGFGGKLDIRPVFQREFIYEPPEQEAVIDTVLKKYPLNSMYWTVRTDKDGKEIGYEILDGQQRTLSICTYAANDFSYNRITYDNLTDVKKKKFLNYPLMVYQCKGTDDEKREWFKTINIAGKELSDQELRNAIYPSPWLTDAKRYFSGRQPSAEGIEGGGYMGGKAIRQDYLATVIRWHSNLITDDRGSADDIICRYMDKHALEDKDSKVLRRYFEDVIEWVAGLFGEARNEMKGINWGILYNEYKDKKIDPIKIRAEVAELMGYDEISKKGIYEYVLTREMKYLNPRAFKDNIKRAVYERQKGICEKCKKGFEIKDMQADHVHPWIKGGRTIPENCQMLCVKCNQQKSDK